MNTEKEMVAYVAICFLTHQTRLWGWCSVQMSHWEWVSEVRPSYIVEYVKVKKETSGLKVGGGAYSTGIHVKLSSLTIPSLWSYPPKCVYVFMWERLMTHPNWESLSSPAVSACLKWWTQDGINSQTPWILLPLYLTSFCLLHLCVYIVMFVHVFDLKVDQLFCVCLREREKVREIEFRDQHYSIKSLLLCFPVLDPCPHTLRPLWNDYMTAILTIWAAVNPRTYLGN